ncbi:UNVERIFIED_CONTAM: hypothetical protein RMT77_001821 [Armadillidium vulgare]
MKLYYLLFFVVVIYKDVHCALDENCIYNEDFVDSKCNHEGFDISFYIPFNWLTWTDNEELIIIIGNITHALRHPSKQFENYPKNYSFETVFLPTDTFSIGWNKISVKKDCKSNEIRIVDQFSRILDKISCDLNNCEQKIKIKGLFATINCNSVYRYYKISRANVLYRIPHIFNETTNYITLSGENFTDNFRVEIYSKRRKFLLCKIWDDSFNYYIREDDCSGLKDAQDIVASQENHIYLERKLEKQTYPLGNFSVTEIFIMSLSNPFYVKIPTYDYFNISIVERSSLPSVKWTFEISEQTIIHMSLHVILVIVIIILIMLCRRERINKSKKLKATPGIEKPLPSNSKDGYDSPEPELYEIKNEFYEDFDTRMSKLKFKEKKDKNSETNSSEGNELHHYANYNSNNK